MGKGRVEAFSDGVIAIIITIMVLELHVPESAHLADLWPRAPVFGAYVLSFLYVGIYWVNHHHLMHTVHRVTGGILWANLHLLFWLSLLPFTTDWISETRFAPAPVFLYALNLLMAGLAYTVLSFAIVRVHGRESELSRALGADLKAKASLGAYAIAMALTVVSEWLAVAVTVAVALMWLIPDRRIERMLAAAG